MQQGRASTQGGSLQHQLRAAWRRQRQLIRNSYETHLNALTLCKPACATTAPGTAPSPFCSPLTAPHCCLLQVQCIYEWKFRTLKTRFEQLQTSACKGSMENRRREGRGGGEAVHAPDNWQNLTAAGDTLLPPKLVREVGKADALKRASKEQQEKQHKRQRERERRKGSWGYAKGEL